MDTPAGNAEVPPSGDKDGWKTQLAKFGVNSLRELATKAIEETPPLLKAFVALGAIGALLALLLAGILAYKDCPVLVFCSGMAAFLLLFGGMVCAMIALSKFFGAHSPRPGGVNSGSRVSESPCHVGPSPTWTRVVPKLEIPPEQLEDLSGRLKEIRRLAHAYLAKTHKEIAEEEVRINVFVADTRQAAYGEICGLFIPRKLHDGMKNEVERQLIFRPNQGLTGRVFAKEKALGAITAGGGGGKGKNRWHPVPIIDSGDDDDDDNFQLTDKQKELIDPNLKWIVGFPLKVEDAGLGRTMGVLNVDGLVHEVSKDEMKLLAFALLPKVKAYAEKISELPKTRITILVEEVPHAAPAKTRSPGG